MCQDRKLINISLLICNNVPSFDEFSILAHDLFLKSKKACSLNEISLCKIAYNKNISSARLFLFDN